MTDVPNLVNRRTGKLFQFISAWASTSFEILVNPRAYAAVLAQKTSRSPRAVSVQNIKFAGTSIILANIIYTLASSNTPVQAIVQLPILAFLLIGWTLYSFLNHIVLRIAGGEAAAKINISVCFMLISVIYVISTFFGVTMAVIFGDTHSELTQELFVLGYAPIVFAMFVIYFFIVFTSLNKLNVPGRILYFLALVGMSMFQVGVILLTIGKGYLLIG